MSTFNPGDTGYDEAKAAADATPGVSGLARVARDVLAGTETESPPRPDRPWVGKPGEADNAELGANLSGGIRDEAPTTRRDVERVNQAAAQVEGQFVEAMLDEEPEAEEAPPPSDTQIMQRAAPETFGSDARLNRFPAIRAEVEAAQHQQAQQHFDSLPPPPPDYTAPTDEQRAEFQREAQAGHDDWEYDYDQNPDYIEDDDDQE